MQCQYLHGCVQMAGDNSQGLCDVHYYQTGVRNDAVADASTEPYCNRNHTCTYHADCRARNDAEKVRRAAID